ncbi:MAG TPA: adenylate/guanylate cyclase domain-containing protein [Candidatus Tumulicola sp.]
MSATLPTGTVTFLFTDVEGSTNLWERCPDAMRDALADHDAIVRRVTTDRGGVVFKTFGDQFCCAFHHAQDALNAAIDTQRALREHPWPAEVGSLHVRIGIHAGKAVERDGDYFGPTVNRVARLMSIGNGEQILVSTAAAALLRTVLPDGVELRDLGAHRLRDLSQPETTYQVVARGLRADFPALASLDARPNNLPSQISSFVGRERELDELRAFLREHRLVTIAGLGGMGKTRLALQLAASTIERFRDGGWFVELASISDPALIAQTIAAELNLREVHSEPIVETLLHHLSGRQLLLVIDNSEHLLDDVAALVKLILSRCAEVTVLVTSREPLHLTGELVYRLSAMPAAPLQTSVADLTLHDGTRLFLERARTIAPNFTVLDDDAAEVAGLCRKLEGIPLAIELAAARVSTLSVRQLNERLSARLPLLASRDGTQERHRTLRATIDWSYRLLGIEEKNVFNKLSVFAGGFTLDACERVSPATTLPIVDVLGSLIEKSFVQVDLNAVGPRFRPLDIMREYGWGELTAAGLAEPAMRDHAAYYAEFAARGRSVSGSAAAPWHRQLDDETHNIRAALDWSVPNEPALAARLALDLYSYWRVRSNVTEARGRLSDLLSAGGVDSVSRAALLCRAASLATIQDDFAESLGFSNEALSLYRAAGDGSGTGEALFRIAEVEHRKGHLDGAKALYEESRELFAAANHPHGGILCAGNLGIIARQRGDYANAKSLLEDAYARAGASGERRIAGDFASALGWANVALGDLPTARQLFEEVLKEKTGERDRYGASDARQGLATVALKDGRLQEAFDDFAATIDAALELRLHDFAFRGFHGIGAVLALAGDLESAARYLGLAERLFQESGRELRDSIAYDVALRALESAIPAPRRIALFADGARLDAAAAATELRSRAPR